MAYKRMLLNLDRTQACADRVDTAIALARQTGAHLSALFCVGRMDLSEGWLTWPDFQNLPPGFHERDLEQANEVLQDFNERASRADVPHDTRRTQAAVELVGEHTGMETRFYDAVIVGQCDPSDPPQGGKHLPEHVMLASACPTLVVPYIGPVRKGDEVILGRRVTIAWDGGREATRAVRDTIPILQQADHVDLVAISPLKGLFMRGDTAVSDFAALLERHGVEPKVHEMGSVGVSVGDAILGHVSDSGSDLLVMGGYGHGYLRELILGGVTRHAFEHMTTPVLFSH